MVTKQRNDSTTSIKGIIYQFLVALNKCFELQEGGKIYIETYGDVSVFNNEDVEQIEAKFYKNNLTDYDHNIWNTLYNWMQDEFPLNSFTSLILLTTQSIGKKCNWLGWNEKTLKQRMECLRIFYDVYKRKHNKSTKTEEILDFIFEVSKKKRLEIIADKLYLDHNSKDDDAYYKKMKDIHARTIPKTRKDSFINSMFGYVFKQCVGNRSWEITYEGFTNEVKNVGQGLIETTVKFPPKIKLNEISEEHYINNSFVEKINEINYLEVISEAINDYVYAKLILHNDLLKFPSIVKSYKEYEDELRRLHESRYKRACRKCNSSNLIFEHSQDFYDEMMEPDKRMTFHVFNYIPSYFSNGILHILADEEDNIKWLIKRRDHE